MTSQHPESWLTCKGNQKWHEERCSDAPGERRGATAKHPDTQLHITSAWTAATWQSQNTGKTNTMESLWYALDHTRGYTSMEFALSALETLKSTSVLPRVHRCFQSKDDPVRSAKSTSTAASDWRENVFGEQKEITHYCVMIRRTWRGKGNENCFLLSPIAKNNGKPICITVSSLAFQAAPKTALKDIRL